MKTTSTRTIARISIPTVASASGSEPASFSRRSMVYLL